jgi:predicted metal-dependent hydrolase
MVAVQIAFDFLRNAVKPARSNAARGSQLAARAETEPRIAHAGHRPALAPEASGQHSVLETSLRSAVRVALRLMITDNRRTMISLRRGQQFVEVRLHHMFLEADSLTRDALADYLFQSDRRAAQHIGRFIEQHRERIRREVARRPAPIATLGTHHDLSEVYRTINQRYFADAVDARITWGRDPHARRARRSIKLGSYTARDRLIRIHPALDAAFVPRFFIEYIVYHEMLHQVLPPKQQHGRRDLHGPAFKAREREFAEYALALRWERENLDRLLRRRTAPRKRAPAHGPSSH